MLMNKVTKYADVPIIDVSPLFSGEIEKKKQVASQIDEACRGSGFFFVKNHGIDLQSLLDVTSRFHATISDKERYELAIAAHNKDNAKQIRNGYSPPVQDKKPFENFCFLNPEFTVDHPAIKTGLAGHEVNVWPDESKYIGFREFQEAYYKSVFELSMKILQGFALALGKEESFFESHATASGTLSSVVLIRYPYLENYPPVQVASDGTKVSLGSHKDVSLITVLFQSNVQNLQVETGEGYLDIPASGDCFLVNAGSYMDYLTNGYYRTPVHRVKFANAERLSIPFFLNLNYESAIAPFVPHDLKMPSKNAPLKYGEYLQRDLRVLIQSVGQT